MKLLRRPMIIGFLVPVLMLQLFHPRCNRTPLFDLLARQPILVSSFVWIPLLEISVLIVERIMLPTTVEAPDKNNPAPGKQPASPIDDVDYLITAGPATVLVAAARKFILPPLKFWQHLGTPLRDEANNNISLLFPLFVILPLFNCSLFRFSLPRGDPPAAPIAC